jgi:formate dehydrogenase major subunit
VKNKYHKIKGMPSAKIDNRLFSFTAGTTILELLQNNAIKIPALCHDRRLSSSSVCRSCLVKVNGDSHWHPSCSTLLLDGMEIETASQEIEDYRKGILGMMAKEYPQSAVKKFPDKEFHYWLNHYGIKGELSSKTKSHKDISHPYIQVDMLQCIKCERCIRICDEVQGQFVWHMSKRGDQEQIVSDSKGLFAQSSCVSCGACVDTCPTGAIEDKNVIQFGFAEKTTRSVCAYCGVGCEINVGTKNEKIIGIHPVMESPVSKGHLCVKGRYAWNYNYAEDRIKHPMIRRNGQWEKVSWEEALDFCSEKLKAISAQYGSDSIGIIGSARATNEENYLIQKFARAVIGTNNIENCARVCHQPTAKAMSMMLGTGAATNSFDDIEKAKTILISGSNATKNHPIVGARIKQAVLKGANLIVIDPRKIELTKYTKYHLQLKAGTNIPLFNAMANVIMEERLFDKKFMENRVEGWEDFQKFISEWTPERAAKICQVPEQLIREAARLYATESPSMCFHGLGLTEHTQGTESVMALVNLALITGNVGKPGAGINPLRGQNNVQGAAVMGCEPGSYTGLASVNKDRERFEKLWNTNLPETKGLTLPEMIDAAVLGNLKSMWIVGYDVYFTMPDSNHTQKAFSNLDLLIVQDMFLTETAKQFANVFLPVASSFEKEGTFMNSERRIQRIRKVISAPANVKSDWEIVCAMAEKMGKKEFFNYTSTEEIWNEIRQAWKAVFGITYQRIEVNGLQWPCPDENHSGTEILHEKSFPIGDKANLFQLDFISTLEQTSELYPFILVTGRELYHFNSGTMTYRTANKEIHPSDFLHIHPDDAIGIKMKDGEKAKILSKYGSAFLKVKIDDSVRKGECFTTFSNAEVFINKITGPFRDNYVQTPEYKITAVRIEKIKQYLNG